MDTHHIFSIYMGCKDANEKNNKDSFSLKKKTHCAKARVCFGRFFHFHFHFHLVRCVLSVGAYTQARVSENFILKGPSRHTLDKIRSGALHYR